MFRSPLTIRNHVCEEDCVCVCVRERESVCVDIYTPHYMNISQQVNSRFTARTWLGSAALAVAVALPV